MLLWFNYTYSFFLFSAVRSEMASSQNHSRVKIFTCCVFCLHACLSRSPSVCHRGRSCWIESGSSPWQSSTGSYGSLATAGWLHTATRRQGIIKSVLLLHHTHIRLRCTQSSPQCLKSKTCTYYNKVVKSLRHMPAWISQLSQVCTIKTCI